MAVILSGGSTNVRSGHGVVFGQEIKDARACLRGEAIELADRGPELPFCIPKAIFHREAHGDAKGTPREEQGSASFPEQEIPHAVGCAELDS
jgi:hypothetical protein